MFVCAYKGAIDCVTCACVCMVNGKGGMTVFRVYLMVSIFSLSYTTGGGAGEEDAVKRVTQSEVPTAVHCYVDAGVLVALPANTSTQRQQDVLNSLLFAQLAACKAYSRENDPEGWFSYFEYVLRNIGWVLTSTKFDVAVNDDYFVFASLALNQMTDNEHWDAEVGTFRGLFNTLRGLPDNDTNIQLLYGNTYNERTQATSLILCSFRVSPDNEVQLRLLMFGFKGIKDTAHRYLFYVYQAKDVEFGKAKSTAMVLNDDIFKKIKSTIVEKLGDRVKTMISEIKISQKQQ